MGLFKTRESRHIRIQMIFSKRMAPAQGWHAQIEKWSKFFLPIDWWCFFIHFLFLSYRVCSFPPFDSNDRLVVFFIHFLFLSYRVCSFQSSLLLISRVFIIDFLFSIFIDFYLNLTGFALFNLHWLAVFLSISYFQYSLISSAFMDSLFSF